MQLAVKDKHITNSPEVSIIWVLYLVFTIGFLGLAYGTLGLLFWGLGIVLKPFQRLGDIVICAGTAFLLKVQPWLTGDYDLKLPKKTAQGRLLISNHKSHLDAFIVLSQVQGVRFFAKKSLFFVPFLGLMMFAMRQIPMNKGSLDGFFRSIETAKKRLSDGDSVHIFAEMTRSEPGFIGTLPFTAAPFHLAIKSGVPLIPIVFANTDQVWPKTKTGISFRIPVRAFSLEPIDSSQFASADDLKIEVKRRIDQALTDFASGART